MIKNYYMDMNLVPSLEYNKLNNIEDLISKDEFDTLTKELYIIILDLLEMEFNKIEKSVLKISTGYLINDISNLFNISIINERTKQKQYNLVFNKEYNSKFNIVHNNLDNFLEKKDFVFPKKNKTRVSFVKQAYNILFKSLLHIPYFKFKISFSANKWTKKTLIDKKIKTLKLVDYSLNNHFQQLTFSSRLITTLVCSIETTFNNKYSNLLTPYFINQLEKIIKYNFDNAYSHYIAKYKFLKKYHKSISEIHTGTLGNINSRTLSILCPDFNIKLYNYLHAGSIAHVKYKIFRNLFIVELMASSNLVTYTDYDFQYIKNELFTNNLIDKYNIFPYQPTLNAMKNIEDIEIKEINYKIKNKNTKVCYITSTQPSFRFLAIPDIPNTFNYEMLIIDYFKTQTNFHFSVKTSPKGLSKNIDLYKKYNFNVINDVNIKVSDIVDDYDIFICRFPQSNTFNEIISAKKPLILLNDTNCFLKEEAKENLGEQVLEIILKDYTLNNNVTELLNSYLNKKEFSFTNKFNILYQGNLI